MSIEVVKNEVSETIRYLRSSQLLGALPEATLCELAANVELQNVPANEVLCNAGDSSDSAFLVVSGRFVAQAGGRAVGDICPGELIGEVSLLTGEPRSASIVARRDSQILELSSEDFLGVLVKHPSCYEAVAGQLVQRLNRVLNQSFDRDRPVLIAVLHDGRVASEETVARFVKEFGPRCHVATGTDIDLAALERAFDVVVLAPDPTVEDQVEWALAQSDRALLFVDASSSDSIARSGINLNRFDRGQVDLVLVQRPDVECPSGTRRWLDNVKPSDHYHVRHRSGADLARVVRRIHGNETVLVLSGGGARGFAHSGLYRALIEGGIEIDAVAGVSAGAIAAAMIAMGHDPQRCGEKSVELFGGKERPIDFTLPTVAVARGLRINNRLKNLCGEDRMIEDLWIPTVIFSANLTTTELHLHKTGPLWRAIRSSTAIPGVFPPVAEPYGLLVDGGLIANLPLDAVRSLHPGATVIASDVGSKFQLLPDDFPAEAEISGWKAMRSRVGRSKRVPGMIQILGQLTAVGGARSSDRRADLHLEFDLDEYGMFDFGKGPEIIQSGYRQSLELADSWIRSQADPVGEPR